MPSGGVLGASLTQYYADAYVSLRNALKLDDGLSKLLKDRTAIDSLDQLLRIRAKAINYQDEFGGVIIGDPWVWQSKKNLLKESTVKKLKRSYTEVPQIHWTNLTERLNPTFEEYSRDREKEDQTYV